MPAPARTEAPRSRTASEPGGPAVRPAPPAPADDAGAPPEAYIPELPRRLPPAPKPAAKPVRQRTDPNFGQPPVQIQLPPLPAAAERRSGKTALSLFLCVVLPTIAIGIYFMVLASPQYITEFRFTVRDARAAAAAGGTDLGAAINLGVSSGIANSPNNLENFMVVDYLTSRQAVDEIQAKLDIRKLFGASDIDWFARFNSSLPDERLAIYWRRMVSASYDPITGIATAEVRAFTPQDSFLIAESLVKMSEELINNIALRPQRDAVRFAEEELKRSEDRLKRTSADLTRFRATEQVIDPQSNVVNSNVLLAQSLRANLAQLQTDLATLRKNRLDQNATVVRQLETRITATREQLAKVEGEVGNSRDGANVLSRVVADYEQLTLERGFAQDQVRTAKANLDTARQNALVQHMYVSTYVAPVLPQASLYPKRILFTVIAAFVFFLFWLVGSLVVRSVREQLS